MRWRYSVRRSAPSSSSLHFKLLVVLPIHEITFKIIRLYSPCRPAPHQFDSLFCRFSGTIYKSLPAGIGLTTGEDTRVKPEFTCSTSKRSMTWYVFHLSLALLLTTSLARTGALNRNTLIIKFNIHYSHDVWDSLTPQTAPGKLCSEVKPGSDIPFRVGTTIQVSCSGLPTIP